MKILFIGDIFGRPGRAAVRKLMPALREELQAEFVVANCENSAGGKGVTEPILRELLDHGIDALTGGNHSFDQKDTDHLFDEEPRLLRPHNFPPGAPGTGFGIFNSAAGFPVAVLNLLGRAYMTHYDDPFRMVDRMIGQARRETPIILLDFHAETTSEKIAMGWYTDGRLSAIFGTHTHIATADERVLPQGTAHITDTGMTGPYDSVIGMDKHIILEQILTLRRARFEVAPANDVRLCGALIDVDPITGRAKSIERVRRDLGTMQGV